MGKNWKTYTGLGIMGLSYLAEAFFPGAGTILQQIGGGLAGVGAVHKLVRGEG